MGSSLCQGHLGLAAGLKLPGQRVSPKLWHDHQQHDTSERRQLLGTGVQVQGTHRSSSSEAVRGTKVCGLWSQGACLSVPLLQLAVVVRDVQDQFMEICGEPEAYGGK